MYDHRKYEQQPNMKCYVREITCAFSLKYSATFATGVDFAFRLASVIGWTMEIRHSLPMVRRELNSPSVTNP